MMRRRLLEDLYDELSPEDKRTFVQLTMQDKRYDDIIKALGRQDKKLNDINRKQSWWYDLTANLAGSAAWDGATWLLSKLFRKL